MFFTSQDTNYNLIFNSCLFKLIPLSEGLFMKVMVVLADGFEEIEAISIIDVLRRAEIPVTIVGLTSTVLEGDHNIKIIADKKLYDVSPDEYSAIVLPGGKAYEIFLRSAALKDMIKRFDEKKKLICAICASPAVLAAAGILDNKEATIYPGMEKEIPKPRPGKVVQDGNVITGQAAGSAILFALKIVENLKGKQQANIIKERLVV